MSAINYPNAMCFPNVARAGRAVLSAPLKQLSIVPFNILPGVFYEELPDLLLNIRQREVIKTIQAVTYLKTLLFIQRYLIFPNWKAQNDQQKAERRLARFIKNVEREIGEHNYAANEKAYREILRKKSDWSRYTATVLFDLTVIQQYRQNIFNHDATSPTVASVIEGIYAKRLALLELNAQVWCEEGGQLELQAKQDAKHDLINIMHTFDKLLAAQAKRDVRNLITMTNTRLGRVKQIVLESYFYQGYKRRFISEGLLIPRFKWQLRSTLNAPSFNEVVAALA